MKIVSTLLPSVDVKQWEQALASSSMTFSWAPGEYFPHGFRKIRLRVTSGAWYEAKTF